MADKQLARSEPSDFDILSDDDPLAELARIVGYDNRPAVQQLQELERHRENVRRDPVFDLEEELLRAFDSYDAPVVPALPNGPAIPDRVEPAAAEVEYHSAPEPIVDEPMFVEPQVPVEHDPEASFTGAVDADIREPGQDDGDADFALMSEYPVVEEAHHNDPHTGATPGFDASGNPASRAPPVFASSPAFDAVDLEHELEMSIGSTAYAVADVQVPDDRMRDHGDWFASEETVADLPDDSTDEAVDTVRLAAVEMPTAIDLAEPVAATVESLHIESAPVVSAAKPDLSDIDALLADIERFPVPSKTGARTVMSSDVVRKNTYPFTPTFSRATPVAAANGVSSQKAFATPLPVAVPAPEAVAALETSNEPDVLPDAVFEPVPPAVTAFVAPAMAPPISVFEPEQEPDFDLDNFELDLSDIELDLDPSDFNIEVDDLAAPDIEDEVYATEPVFAPLRPFEPIAAFAADEPDFADDPIQMEPTDGVLPFDPSMISETEENPTVIADLNVPHLPVIEQERPIAYQPDYDLDIDAEMAQLFTTPDRGSRRGARSANTEDAGGVFGPASPFKAQGSAVADDFDAFEKAMEEDFRRSLSQKRETDPAQGGVSVGGTYTPEVDYSGEITPNYGRRRALIAAAIAGVLIFGGVGGYAVMGGAGSVLSDSDPKIIFADKTPVKVVPIEKGGKTVPNQDKAVYDRVAGAQDQAPQQGALVTSTEEPMDVVQRTLTPETLPLEGRGEIDPALASPVDDDGSDRLTPDTAGAANDSASQDAVPAVSPRKVRTMIVKPDGTLVAREDPVPAQTTETAQVTDTAAEVDPVANPATGQTPVQGETSVQTPTQGQATSTDTDTASLDTLRSQQAQTPDANAQSALAQAADAKVNDDAKIIDDGKPGDDTAVPAILNSPIPQPRPVYKPVKAVETAAAQPVAKLTTVAAVESKPLDAAPLQTTAVASGSYVIQIASLPSEAEAKKSYSTLSGKFSGVIAGKGVDIKKAEIAGKGTYFRVRIPAGSRDDANSLCTRYKSAGGSCIVTK